MRHDEHVGGDDGYRGVCVSRTTDVSCEQLWRPLADPYSYASWVAGTAVIRRADPDWPAAGARLHHRFGVWPLHVRDHSTVIESRPPHRLVLLAGAWPLGVVRAELTISDRRPGSTITLREVMLSGMGFRFRRISNVVQRYRNRRSLERLIELSRPGASGRGSRPDD